MRYSLLMKSTWYFLQHHYQKIEIEKLMLAIKLTKFQIINENLNHTEYHVHSEVGHLIENDPTTQQHQQQQKPEHTSLYIYIYIYSLTCRKQ